MNRWSIRILGMIMLLVLLFMLFALQKRLLEIQVQQRRSRPAAPPTP
jgi:hypothetical protein